MNRKVTILSGKLYSPSLKAVAWLERAQLIFLIFHTFVCNFGRVEAGRRGKKLQTNVWTIRKINWVSSIQPTFSKLSEYNLLLSILTVRFINCVKFNFGKVICHRIPTQTQFLIALPTRQDGAENRDKAYLIKRNSGRKIEEKEKFFSCRKEEMLLWKDLTFVNF